MTLPDPECQYGYTEEQLSTILGERIDAFNHWMRGQTMSICDGRRYDYDKGEYEDTGCGPHGVITYRWDVQRFIDGRPIVD